MMHGSPRFAGTGLRARAAALAFVALLFASGSSLANETEWLSRFGTPGYDASGGIARDATGIYVTGSQAALPSQNQSLSTTSAFVRRYALDGTLVWKREFAFGTYSTGAGAIAVDGTGVYVAGTSDFGGFVRKYDLDGNHQWTRHLYREADRLTTLAGAWGIALDATSIYVVGASSTDCSDSCLTNAVITRLDRSGNELWTAVAGRPFDAPYNRVDAIAYDVKVDETGVYVSGRLGDADVRRYGVDGARTGSFGPGSLWGEGLALDASGVYVVGLPCPEACQFATSMRKYDRSGTELWQRDLPSGFVAGTSIALVDDAVYVGGNFWRTFTDGPYLAYVRKYDANGGFVWSDEFGLTGAVDTQASAIAADASGVYLAGTAYPPGTPAPPYSDAYVIKRNENAAAAARLLSLGDVDHDGAPELAAVGHDDAKQLNWAVVKNSKTRATVNRWTVPDTAPAADAVRVADVDGNGAPEIALLSATTHAALLRDGFSGGPLGTVAFDATWNPIRLASLRSQAGSARPTLALLEEKDGAVQVELRNAPGGALVRRVDFASSRSYEPKDLVVIADQNANGAAELAVLQRGVATGAADRVEIRDSLTGDLVRTVGFGVASARPRQLLAIPDVNGNGAQELAVLRRGSGVVDVRDARSAALVSSLAFGKAYTPLQIAVTPDYSGNGLPELSMLQSHAGDGKVRIASYDVVTREWLGATYYGNEAVVRPDDLGAIQDISGNGVPELVRLGTRVSDGAVVGQIRDARSGPVGGEIRFYP